MGGHLGPTRTRMWGAVLVAWVVLTSGCEDGSPSPDPGPTALASATGTASAVGALAGVWERTTDTMNVVLRIDPDGDYRSVEVYTPVEARGVYTLKRVEDGTSEVGEASLRLVGRTAILSRRATDDAAHNYDKPTPVRVGAYSWQVDGGELHLVDAEGVDAVFTRRR